MIVGNMLRAFLGKKASYVHNIVIAHLVNCCTIFLHSLHLAECLYSYFGSLLGLFDQSCYGFEPNVTRQYVRICPVRRP